jgi:transcriptional regulator GlxA family with amidase domain
MRVAYVVYPGFTALDLVGPYEVISRWPGAEVCFVSTCEGPVRADAGLVVVPDAAPEDIGAVDMIVMPGGAGTAAIDASRDPRLTAWVRETAPGLRWLVSVCSGSLVYAAAGVLDGRRATTHWGMRENLRAAGVEVVPERVVFDGRVVTGAGVSAGIDLALALTARVHGEELAKSLQLVIEYDPRPPFASGSPDQAAGRGASGGAAAAQGASLRTPTANSRPVRLLSG